MRARQNIQHTSRLLTMTSHSRNFLAAPGCSCCNSERTAESSSRSFSFADLLVDMRSYTKARSVAQSYCRLMLTISPRSESRTVSHTPHFRSIALSLPCFDSNKANILLRGSSTEESLYRPSTSLNGVSTMSINGRQG